METLFFLAGLSFFIAATVRYVKQSDSKGAQSKVESAQAMNLAQNIDQVFLQFRHDYFTFKEDVLTRLQKAEEQVRTLDQISAYSTKNRVQPMETGVNVSPQQLSILPVRVEIIHKYKKPRSLLPAESKPATVGSTAVEEFERMNGLPSYAAPLPGTIEVEGRHIIGSDGYCRTCKGPHKEVTYVPKRHSIKTNKGKTNQTSQ